MNRIVELPSFLIERVNRRTIILRRKDRHLVGLPHRSLNHQRQQGQQQQMSTLAPIVLGTRAAAYVDSDGVTPVYRRQRGFANVAITRNGAGDYTLTLQDALDTAAGGDVLIQATVNNNAFADIAVDLASATTIRTRTATTTAVPAVAGADLDYWIEVKEFGPN